MCDNVTNVLIFLFEFFFLYKLSNQVAKPHVIVKVRVSECWGLTSYQHLWSFHGESMVGNLSVFDGPIYEVI